MRSDNLTKDKARALKHLLSPMLGYGIPTASNYRRLPADVLHRADRR
jgi:hypothetical protein